MASLEPRWLSPLSKPHHSRPWTFGISVSIVETRLFLTSATTLSSAQLDHRILARYVPILWMAHLPSPTVSQRQAGLLILFMPGWAHLHPPPIPLALPPANFHIHRTMDSALSLDQWLHALYQKSQTHGEVVPDSFTLLRTRMWLVRPEFNKLPGTMGSATTQRAIVRNISPSRSSASAQ